MAAYLRIENLDPEDLDEADPELFNDLANGVFAHLRDAAPELYERHGGVVPVHQPEHDPRVLETTAVYAHRAANPDDGVSDDVFVSFDDSVEGPDAPGGYASPKEFVEVQLMQAFDDGREALDDLLPTETKRDEQGDSPVRAGTLFYDSTSKRVVRVTFDEDAFETEGGSA